MDETLYYKIYLDGVSGFDKLRFSISQLIGGELVSVRSVKTDLLVVDVFDNLHIDNNSSPEEFMNWPFFLEIESANSGMEKTEQFLDAVAHLVSGLRSQGFRTVLSGDLEDRLNDRLH